jgi:hypothetical protein
MEEPSVPVQPVKRKLAAIFAADIAGYSRLMARDEIGTFAPLKALRAIIDRLRAITPQVVPTVLGRRNPDDRELLLSGLRLAMGETA